MASSTLYTRETGLNARNNLNKKREEIPEEEVRIITIKMLVLDGFRLCPEEHGIIHQEVELLARNKSSFTTSKLTEEQFPNAILDCFSDRHINNAIKPLCVLLIIKRNYINLRKNFDGYSVQFWLLESWYILKKATIDAEFTTDLQQGHYPSCVLTREIDCTLDVIVSKLRRSKEEFFSFEKWKNIIRQGNMHILDLINNIIHHNFEALIYLIYNERKRLLGKRISPEDIFFIRFEDCSTTTTSLNRLGPYQLRKVSGSLKVLEKAYYHATTFFSLNSISSTIMAKSIKNEWITRVKLPALEKPSNCSICFNQFCENLEPVMLSGCQHTEFCHECVYTMIEQNPEEKISCPICRKESMDFIELSQLPKLETYLIVDS